MTTVIYRQTLKPRTRARRQRFNSLVLTGCAWVVGLLFVLPIIWMILTALHSEVDASSPIPKVLAPLTLDNFIGLFGGGNTLRPLVNSMIVSLVSTVAVLLLALPAAYALAIRRISNWKDVLLFLLGTKMMPFIAGLLPLYVIANWIGILGTRTLIVLVYMTMNLPIAIWMLRSFLLELPTEILEAAELDGASLFRQFISIITPLSAPGLAATALICFIFSWNELLAANVLTNSTSLTAPVYLTGFVTGQGFFLAKVASISILISAPILIAGYALQDRLVQGLSLGAVK